MKAIDFTSLLTSVLADRVVRNQPTLISLVAGIPVLFRPRKAFNATDKVTVAQLAGGSSAWQPFGKISRLLDGAVPRLNSRWAEILLPLLTISACDWATRLAKQMGAELTTSVNLDAMKRSFATSCDTCLRDVKRAQQLASGVTSAMLKWMTSASSRCSSGKPSMLRLEIHGDTTRATWLADDGRELCHETLEQLENRISASPEVANRLDAIGTLHAQRERHRLCGDRMLHTVCADLAQALQSARENGRCVGYRMFSSTVRDLPAEVRLFIDPGVQGSANVHLMALRAHEEFVLESVEHALFYFPPVQLAAVIEFTVCCPTGHVAVPRIRMPRNHPPWTHPYTGPLSGDRFARAIFLNPGHNAMANISTEAKQLFPALENSAISTSGMSDICLNGQQGRVTQLVRRAGLSGKEPDLFGLVRGLWDLLRQGLTRAHQYNTDGPRAPLTHGNMHYAIPNRAVLANTRLARRVFSYNSK